MEHTVRQRALRRLKIIAGQVRGLERLIDQNAYCVDVIHQSLAIKEALSSLEDLILRNHVVTHVAQQVKAGQVRRASDELVTLYRLAKRK